MSRQDAKEAGAYYTPEAVVASLLRWALRAGDDRLLDPACGDGRFVATHPFSTGVEQNGQALAVARARAPHASLHEGDFFAWAARSPDRFDCAVGNPPFIRYQTFKGEARERALRLCARLGAAFSGLTSSWAPFLVAAAGLLKPGGRMAFVVPAEIGHAPYAAPLLDYLVAHFGTVQVVAVREKLFPDLSEDCWLLYADGFGGSTQEIRFSALDRFAPSAAPPSRASCVPVGEWRCRWRGRLRPYVLPDGVRDAYRAMADHPGSRRLADLARVGIGYVSGANDFFHLRPSDAALWDIPATLLHPSVRNGRALPTGCLTEAAVEEWRRSDDPVLLLRLPRAGDLPSGVRRYLDSAAGLRAREAYKCRTRDPWYSVPDVQTPDFFLSYMSGITPNLVRNGAVATCTNSVHCVRLRDRAASAQVAGRWGIPFVQLSCEVEGHPLGGGMLKLEPREASEVVLPDPDVLDALSGVDVAGAVAMLRSWRHYGGRHAAP